MELQENCFFWIGSKLDIFQVFYKYIFLLSIFLLELCWDAKKQFFLQKMLRFHVAVYSRVPKRWSNSIVSFYNLRISNDMNLEDMRWSVSTVV